MSEVRRSVLVLSKQRLNDGATRRDLEQELEEERNAVESLQEERKSVRKLASLAIRRAGTKTVNGVRGVGSAAKNGVARLRRGAPAAAGEEEGGKDKWP